MLVKIMPNGLGSKILLLCDEEGVPFPSIIDLKVKGAVDDLSTITVTFVIDGTHVRFAD